MFGTLEMDRVPWYILWVIWLKSEVWNMCMSTLRLLFKFSLFRTNSIVNVDIIRPYIFIQVWIQNFFNYIHKFFIVGNIKIVWSKLNLITLPLHALCLGGCGTVKCCCTTNSPLHFALTCLMLGGLWTNKTT